MAEQELGMCGSAPSSFFSLGSVSAYRTHPVLLLLSANFRLAGSARAVGGLQLSNTLYDCVGKSAWLWGSVLESSLAHSYKPRSPVSSLLAIMVIFNLRLLDSCFSWPFYKIYGLSGYGGYGQNYLETTSQRVTAKYTKSQQSGRKIDLVPSRAKAGR